MYKSFEVRNFRCFRRLKVAGLTRVNLIAGVNNIGKTALLEALFIHCGAYNPSLTLRLNAFRGIDVMEIELAKWGGTPWDLLFSHFETLKMVELVGENEKNDRRILRLKVVREPKDLEKIPFLLSQLPSRPEQDKPEITPLSLGPVQVLELQNEEKETRGNFYMILDHKGIRVEPFPMSPPFPAYFHTARFRTPAQEEVGLFGKLEIQGKQDVLLQVLQLIEPRLSRLAMVVMADKPILHGDIGIGRLMPIAVMGDGMTRLTNLILYVANAQNGVVLIDEIENGLHHSVMPKVWQAIGDAALQFNTQVFATTHSFECIAAAHRGLLESKSYDFRLHRLERIGETIQAVTYDQESLESAIKMGLEVR